MSLKKQRGREWINKAVQPHPYNRTFTVADVPALLSCPRPFLARPLNRILVAQRITQPQMVTGLVVAVQHVAACWLLIHHWGYGYLGAAFAACWSTFLSLALLAAWVALAGKGEQASWLWAVGGNRLECGRASPAGNVCTPIKQLDARGPCHH